MAGNLGGKSVVLCEDEAATLIFLRRVLERAGMRVLACATDARDSVDQVLRERPEIVLINARLPSLGGTEAVRRILRTYHTYRPCIVIMSSTSDEEDRREAMEAGAAGYIVKPFSASALLTEIEQAVESERCGDEAAPEGAWSHSGRRKQNQSDLSYSASPA